MSGRKTEQRTEKDRFGEISLPANVYWGAQTARSCQNGIKLSQLNPRFLEALLLLHKAAALTNVECGRLEPVIGRTIAQVVDETLSGQWQDQFIIAPLQLASTFDIIANVREVLANRAGEILGARVGSYTAVLPHEHVGLELKTQDVFPTALRLGLFLLQKDLGKTLRDLERLLRRKAFDFEHLTRSEPQAQSGAGQAQSLPTLNLAQIFNGFGFEVDKVCKHISLAAENLLELNLHNGGCTSSSGTPGQVQLIVDKLASYTGLNLRQADDYARISQSANDFLELSAALRLLAVTLNSIAGELHSITAGARQATFEISLPAVHFGLAGVSGPEYARPVIPEFVSVAAFQVIGMDAANALSGQVKHCKTQGMLALIAHNLLHSIELLQQTVVIFNRRCIAGISTNALPAGTDTVSEPALTVVS